MLAQNCFFLGLTDKCVPKFIQLSFDTNLVAKRRTSRTFKAILLSVFKLFREKVASLVNIYSKVSRA